MRTFTLFLFFAICGSVQIVNCQPSDRPLFYWLSPNTQYNSPWSFDSLSGSDERTDESDLSALFSSSSSSSSSGSGDESAIFEPIYNSEEEDRGQENLQDAIPEGLPTDQQYDDENDQSLFTQIDATDFDSESSESSSDSKSESSESIPTKFSKSDASDESSDSYGSVLDKEFMRRFNWLKKLLKSIDDEKLESEDSEKSTTDLQDSQETKTMESVDSMDESGDKIPDETTSPIRNVEPNVSQNSEVEIPSETSTSSITEEVRSDDSDADDSAYLNVPVIPTESLLIESDNFEDTVDESDSEYEAKTETDTEIETENEYMTGTVIPDEEIPSSTCESDRMDENVETTEVPITISTESYIEEEEQSSIFISIASTDDSVAYSEISEPDETLSRQDESMDTSSIGIVNESEPTSNPETEWDFKEPNEQEDFISIQETNLKSETAPNWVSEDQNKPIEKDIMENEITKDELPGKKTPEKPMISIGKFLRSLIGMMHE